MGVLSVCSAFVCGVALTVAAGAPLESSSQASRPVSAAGTVPVPAAGAPVGVASEYQVKAAFLYNFGKFVDWPAESFPSPSSAFTLCVLGDDPFGDILDRTVQGKLINGHPVTPRRLTRDDDLRACHILYISSSERRSIAEILQRLRGVSVLTVGDTQGLAERGGMFNFVIEDNRVRFEANPTAAERSRLHISSKLLALARVVQGGESR